MALAVSLLIQVMGERLTTRLRDMAFRNIMRMDIAWFDKEENSTGAITARLATEVTLVKVRFGERMAWRGERLRRTMAPSCSCSGSGFDSHVNKRTNNLHSYRT